MAKKFRDLVEDIIVPAVTLYYCYYIMDELVMDGGLSRWVKTHFKKWHRSWNREEEFQKQFSRVLWEATEVIDGQR